MNTDCSTLYVSNYCRCLSTTSYPFSSLFELVVWQVFVYFVFLKFLSINPEISNFSSKYKSGTTFPFFFLIICNSYVFKIPKHVFSSGFNFAFFLFSITLNSSPITEESILYKNSGTSVMSE